MWAKHKQQAGFTIVELLIVIVVIGILAALSIVAYTGIQNRAYDAAVQSDMRNFGTKVMIYANEVNNGSYPIGGDVGAGSNTFAFDFKFTKNAYMDGVNNVYYCQTNESGDDRFAVVAQSKSGKSFAYSSIAAAGFRYMGTFSTSNVICPGVGIPTSVSDSFSYGRQSTNNWFSWSNG